MPTTPALHLTVAPHTYPQAPKSGNPAMPSTPERFTGKIALVTGATGGIGEATVRRLLDEGGAVMAVGRDPDRLAGTLARLDCPARLAGCLAQADDEAAMAAAVAATVERFGGLDICVANAGFEGVIHRSLELQEREDVDAVLRTNVVGVWLAIKHSIAPMRRRGGGAIVALASMAAQIGFAGAGPYIASKHAVAGLVKTAALELGVDRIRVNAVAPGPIENRMMRSIETQIAPGDPAAVHESLRSKLALGRYGSNAEVAAFIAFLASDAAPML